MLKAKTFLCLGIRSSVESDVVDFINWKKITRENIQQIIVNGNGDMTLFYWEEKDCSYDNETFRGNV